MRGAHVGTILLLFAPSCAAGLGSLPSSEAQRTTASPDAGMRLSEAAASHARSEAVVLMVDESGSAAPRELLFGPDASAEAALRACDHHHRGHVVLRVRLTDTRMTNFGVAERSAIADAGIDCITEALSKVPLRGGLNAEQLIYVRLP